MPVIVFDYCVAKWYYISVDFCPKGDFCAFLRAFCDIFVCFSTRFCCRNGNIKYFLQKKVKMHDSKGD